VQNNVKWADEIFHCGPIIRISTAHQISLYHHIQLCNITILATKPDIWTASSGKPLRKSSIVTTRTGKAASPEVRNGSLSLTL
jgi:hypothetical protein